jgi:hypothetical protein
VTPAIAIAPRRVRALGAISAALLCATVLSACSSTAAPDGEADAVLIDSGTTANIGWDLWAWEDDGQLCMGMGDESAPNSTQNAAAPGQLSGSQCGFNDKTEGKTYYVSAQNAGNGPPTVALLFGPVPAAAVSVQVTSKITLKTTDFPSGAGLPSVRYWVWAGPYQPLDAQGKAVPFQAY